MERLVLAAARACFLLSGVCLFFFSSRRRHTRFDCDWSSDVCSSDLLAIVDELERQRIDPKTTSLKVGIFGAEPWTEEMRREIEARLDMHAVDIYGQIGRASCRERV